MLVANARADRYGKNHTFAVRSVSAGMLRHRSCVKMADTDRIGI